MFSLCVRGRPIVAVVDEEIVGEFERATISEEENPTIGSVVEITEGGDPTDSFLAIAFEGVRFKLIGWTRFGPNAVLQLPPWVPSVAIGRMDWPNLSFTAERSDSKEVGRFTIAKSTSVRKVTS